LRPGECTLTVTASSINNEYVEWNKTISIVVYGAVGYTFMEPSSWSIPNDGCTLTWDTAT
jgi:hypothetical protein